MYIYIVGICIYRFTRSIVNKRYHVELLVTSRSGQATSHSESGYASIQMAIHVQCEGWVTKISIYVYNWYVMRPPRQFSGDIWGWWSQVICIFSGSKATHQHRFYCYSLEFNMDCRKSCLVRWSSHEQTNLHLVRVWPIVCHVCWHRRVYPMIVSI